MHGILSTPAGTPAPPQDVLRTWELYYPKPHETIVEVLAIIPALEDELMGALSSSESATAAFPCRLCERGFASEGQRSEHVSESHPMKCPDCGKEFSFTDAMRRHARRTHGSVSGRKTGFTCGFEIYM